MIRYKHAEPYNETTHKKSLIILLPLGLFLNLVARR